MLARRRNLKRNLIEKKIEDRKIDIHILGRDKILGE